MKYLRRWKWGLAVLLLGAGSAILLGSKSEGGLAALCASCLSSDGRVTTGVSSNKASFVDSVAEALSPKKGELYNMSSTEKEPIACTLSSSDLVERKDRIQTEILSQASERKELPDGLEFTFPGASKLSAKLVEFIELERACCSFLRFNLAFEASGGPVVLSITGEEGVKDFLTGAFKHFSRSPG